MMMRLKFDLARNHLLTTFFEMHLGLSGREEHILANEVNQLDTKEVEIMELMISYERRGMKKGTQDSILTFLEARFGSTVQEQVRSIEDVELLLNFRTRLTCLNLCYKKIYGQAALGK